MSIYSETYESVWGAICDTRAEAADLELRSTLMRAITDRVESWALPQKDAAKRLGLTRPRLDELMRGKRPPC